MKKVALLLLLPILTLVSCKDCDPLRCEQIVVLQPDADYGKDAFLHSEFPDRTHGNSKDNVITAWTFYALGKGPGMTRVLLEFDITSVPEDAIIDEAKLSLFNSKTTNNNQGEHSQRNGSNACDVLRITESWAEHEVTWNNQPAATTDLGFELEASTTNTQDYTDINITELVKFWHKSPSENHGVLFRLKNENYYRCLVFASSDSPYAETRPKLEIKYH